MMVTFTRTRFDFADRKPDGSEIPVAYGIQDEDDGTRCGWSAVVANDDGFLCNVGEYHTEREALAAARAAVAQIAVELIEETQLHYEVVEMDGCHFVRCTDAAGNVGETRVFPTEPGRDRLGYLDEEVIEACQLAESNIRVPDRSQAFDSADHADRVNDPE